MVAEKFPYRKHREIVSAMDNISQGTLFFDVKLFPLEARSITEWVKLLPLSMRRSMARRYFGMAKRRLDRVGV